jgi:hypothetical protein
LIVLAVAGVHPAAAFFDLECSMLSSTSDDFVATKRLNASPKSISGLNGGVTVTGGYGDRGVTVTGYT